MLRKTLTIIELIIIVFVLVAGGYRLYKNHQEDTRVEARNRVLNPPTPAGYEK